MDKITQQTKYNVILSFKNFQISTFFKKNVFFKFRNGEKYKKSERDSNRFVDNALIHCPTVLGNKVGKEITNIILDFIVYFHQKKSQYGGVQFHLNILVKNSAFVVKHCSFLLILTFLIISLLLGVFLVLYIQAIDVFQKCAVQLHVLFGLSKK